jgi:hypothetical protein
MIINQTSFYYDIFSITSKSSTPQLEGNGERIKRRLEKIKASRGIKYND